MADTNAKRRRGNPDPTPQTPKKRRKWLRVTLLLLFVAGWLGVLGTWFAVREPGEWGSFFANLQFSKVGSALFGAREPTHKSGLTYFGDGKAELGDFSIKIFDPLTGASLRSDFHLEGNTVFGDEEQFDRFMQRNRRLFREQVTVAMRACNVRELVNPDLNLLEKKLASRVNRAMGREVLKSVRITNHALYESANDVYVPVEGTGSAP